MEVHAKEGQISRESELEILFGEGTQLLSMLSEPGSDKESVMSDFLMINNQIGKIFGLEPDLFWTNASFDYLQDSSRDIMMNLLGLRLCVIDLAGSLLFSFEHEDDWKNACTRRSALAFLFSNYEDTALPTKLTETLDITELDRRLREVGVRENNLQASEIPAGIPEDHWWWRVPLSITPRV